MPTDLVAPPLPPPNWYRDPVQAGLLRYWDGTQWTHRTRPPVRLRWVLVTVAFGLVGIGVTVLANFVGPVPPNGTYDDPAVCSDAALQAYLEWPHWLIWLAIAAAAAAAFVSWRMRVPGSKVAAVVAICGVLATVFFLPLTVYVLSGMNCGL